MGIDDLERRMAIADTLANCALNMDAHNVEGWVDSFTDDGVFRMGDQQIVGRESLRGYAQLHAQVGTRHIVSSPVINISPDGTSANTLCTIVVILATQTGYRVVFAGTYNDELVCRDRKWRIRHRLAEAEPMPDAPDLPVVLSDADTRDLAEVVMNAWQKYAVPAGK